MQKIGRGLKNAVHKLDFNAPVVLWMALISFVLLLLNGILGGALNRFLAAYYTSFLDIGMYFRLFTHVLMHADLAHYTSNFLLILVIGPMVEEKYGSLRLLGMIAVTAVVTGLFHVLFSRGTMLMGASGVVFMLILLASFTNLREGKVPLTVILVALLYIGNEVLTGITERDAVSHVSHILGGLCGAGFGYLYNSRKPRKA